MVRTIQCCGRGCDKVSIITRIKVEGTGKLDSSLLVRCKFAQVAAALLVSAAQLQLEVRRFVLKVLKFFCIPPHTPS